MVYCNSCNRDAPLYYDNGGQQSCSNCGKVSVFDVYSTEVQFTKNSSGQSQAMGRIVNSMGSDGYSRERLLENARDNMIGIKNDLRMGDDLSIVDQALQFYRIAVDKNFTKGRRTEQVQAACLYIACRENRRPYLLIDFSNYLRINIYVLGAVFLQLCKCLNLHEHPICQNLLDPSLFIDKYTANLAGGKNKEISDVALAIIASMNRDWMQTGRRPSGLWGAALYISALAHGLTCSKTDILKLVHVCEQTLTKRLVEFENTESGSLTIEELNAKAEEFKESVMEQSSIGSKAGRLDKMLCQHKGRSSFAYGLCEECYAYIVGSDGGSDPPAFQRAERQRKKSSCMDKTDDRNSVEKEMDQQPVQRKEQVQPRDSTSTGAAHCVGEENGDCHKVNGGDDASSKEVDESDNFSDIDDAEVDGYLHNEEEKRFKKIIWEEMNKEYLEEQAAKEAAEAAIKEAWREKFKNSPERLEAAKELEAALAEAAAKSKKERQQKRAAEAKNLMPPKSASEAAHRLLTKKRVSSRINYDVLEKLFDESGSKDTKKLRTESLSDNDENLGYTTDKDPGLEEASENGFAPGDENEHDDYYGENIDEAYDEEDNYDDYDAF
ncbi:hypothetical protein Tsubulata_007659 [Turnera subulata]|uniref:TFIIB-type domain-containing protein n=1 Tax=Turnera subulata TaxID=218843 RepID=A0A9Q0G2H3_9ROSI|nr:hypothetical protein Tsubulata_007659 [Turnera subulata]